MIKTTTLLLTLLVAVQNPLWAQVAPELTKKYPWHVVSRILEINSKVNLPLTKQLRLAEFFTAEDSLAKVQLNNGLTAEQVGVNCEVTNEKLLMILSPQEFSNYYVSASHKSDSQLSNALSYKAILGLNDLQVTKLTDANKLLKQKRIYNMSTRNSFPYDENLLEGGYLKEILSDIQYSRFLSLSGKPTAASLTAKNWYAIKNAGLSNGKDSIELNTQMMNYYVFKEAGNLRILQGMDQLKADSIHRSITRFKPPVLIKLDAIITESYSSQLANAIRYRQELKLNEIQLTKLLDAHVLLEKRNANLLKGETFDTLPFEGAQLTAILNDKQYKDFLYMNTQNLAKSLTRERWDELSRLRLTKSLDSAKTNQEIYSYMLDREVLATRRKNESRIVNVDSLNKMVELYKPLILFKLDVYKNVLPASNFSAAIKFRKEIGLKGPQLDSLLKRVKDFERVKTTILMDEWQGKPPSLNRKQYETDELTAILDAKQLTIYLHYKNYEKAMDLTLNAWARIKRAGLSEGLDSAMVNKQNLNYQIALLSAADRIGFNQGLDAAEYKRQATSRKPVVLAKLEEMDRKNLSARDAKKSFAW